MQIFLSVLPESLSRPETQALSAAIRVGLLRLQDYSRAISMYAALRDLPDEVLNLLAVELRTQYYDPAAKRKKREDMVRQTIAWYFRGGTGAVLTEYLATLYQGGRLKEWYDYGGAPYFFKAVVELALDDEIRPGDGERIAERINTYKNVRSWLEDLAFHIGADFSGANLIQKSCPLHHRILSTVQSGVFETGWQVEAGRNQEAKWI